MPPRYRLTLHNTPTSTASARLPPTPATHIYTCYVRPPRPRPAARSVIPRPPRHPSWLSSSFTTAGGFVKRRCDPRRPPAAPDQCRGASAAVKHAPTRPQAAERLPTRPTRRSRRRNQSRLNMPAQIFTRQGYNTHSNSVTRSCVRMRNVAGRWEEGKDRANVVHAPPPPSHPRPCPHG